MPRIGLREGQFCVIRDDQKDGAEQIKPDLSVEEKSIEVVSKGQLKQELLPLGLQLLQNAGIKANDIVVIIVDNDSTSVGVIAALKELRCFGILIGKSRAALLDAIAIDTGVTKAYCVEHESKSLTICDKVSSDDYFVNGKPAWYEKNAELALGGGLGFLTSGTCGHPKVVVHAWNALSEQSIEVDNRIRESKSDAFLQFVCCTSIAHAYSFSAVCSLLSSVHDKSTEKVEGENLEVLLVSDNHSQLLKLLMNFTNDSKKHIVLLGSPGSYAVLLHVANGVRHPLNVDLAICAGTSLKANLYEQVKNCFGLQLIQCYGTTETGHVAFWNMDETALEKAKNVFLSAVQENPPRFYLGSTLKGISVSCGPKENELLIRTPWHALGYVRNQVLDSFEGKFCRTGDRATIISDDGSNRSHIWLCGRIRSEATILDPRCPLSLTFSPECLEAALTERNDVTDAAVAVQNTTKKSSLHLNGKSKIVAHIVCQNHNAAQTSASEYRNAIAVWLAENNAAVPLDLIHVEIKEYLSCSAAGKLVYDLRATN